MKYFNADERNVKRERARRRADFWEGALVVLGVGCISVVIAFACSCGGC